MNITTLSLSPGAVNFVNGQGRLIARSLGLPEKEYDNTFTIRIYRDVIIEANYITKLPSAFKDSFNKKYLKATTGYQFKIDNTLKIGYFTLDAWRISKMLQGDWNEQMLAIYLKVVREEQITPRELEVFFNSRRVQYSGTIKDDHLNTVPLFHNFIQLPLIPSMIKNTKLDALNVSMITEGDDYCIFESCKLTRDDSLNLYEQDGISRNLIADYVNPFTRHKIFSRYFGEII